MNVLQQWLGIGSQSITWYQASLRTVIVYIAALVMVQIGRKRFIGKSTAFDFIVGIILGSLVTGAINSTSAPFLGTLVAGFVLVGLHWLFAYITFKSDRLDNLLKGSSRQLVENGEILWDAMEKSDITRDDLLQQVRTVNHTEDLASIKKAFFERSGDISMIPNHSQPRVIEVKVEKGVQTVRVIMES